MKRIIVIVLTVVIGIQLAACKNTTNNSSKNITNNKIKKVQLKGGGRYVSKDCFYTDFEGESMIQTDVEDANTICQRGLNGELLNSYPMGSDFYEIFYVDTDWLYYLTEKGNKVTTVYRVPIIKEDDKEKLDISKKEKVFTEKNELTDSDFVENLLMEYKDHTFYYMTKKGAGSYNIKTKEQKLYSKKDTDDLIATGTNYMLVENKNRKDILIDLKTNQRQKVRSECHPWVRMGKDYYVNYPYDVGFGVGDVLVDLNSREIFSIITEENIKNIAEKMEIPWDKKECCASLQYIGNYNHRIYAQITYLTTVKDNKHHKKITFYDGVCVSRNVDKESDWKIEKDITKHARKQIEKYYQQVSKGEYKQNDDEYEVHIGEGVTNGIFYFDPMKDRTMDLYDVKEIDIYDIDSKEIRTIKRNDVETIYPLYDYHELITRSHTWQSVFFLAPITSQGEEGYVQELKKK